MSDAGEVIGVHRGAVDAIVAVGDRVVTGGRDGRIVSWDATGGAAEVLLALDAEAWPKPIAMAATPGGVLVALTNCSLLRVGLDGSASEVPTPAFDDGLIDVTTIGDWIAIAGDDNRVEVIDDAGASLWRGETYKWPYAMAASPSGKRLVVGTWDGYAYVVSVDPFPSMDETGGDDQPYTELPYPNHPATVSPIFAAVWLDEERVALGGVQCGSETGAVRIWRPGAKAWEPGAFDTAGGIHAIALSPDGRTLAVGGNDRAVTLLSAHNLAVLRRWELGAASAAVKGDPDAEFIHRLKRRGVTLVDGQDTSRDVDWSTDAYFPVAVEFYSGTGPTAVFSLAWSSDGTSLYAGTQGGGVIALRL